MRVRLLKTANVKKVLAGEIIQVSPDSGRWLLENGLAEIADVPQAVRETPEKATTKTTRKK